MKQKIYIRANRVYNKMCCAVNKNGFFGGFVTGNSKEKLKEKLKGSGYHKYGNIFFIS